MSRFKVLFDGEYENEVFDTEEDRTCSILVLMHP